MTVTPAELFALALERHQQHWNWSFQFVAALVFGLVLLFHSYLLLAVSLVLFGVGFFQLNLPPFEKKWWISFVKKGVEWEKNWIAAPWNLIKWRRFLFVLVATCVLVWALWIREYAALGLILGFAYLVKVKAENKAAGIDV
jgi:glucan phosphoethanolaminetransferase (alkaline phosphatase superfamily)